MTIFSNSRTILAAKQVFSLEGFRLDWKPFDDVGKGTREIRIRDAFGIFRVMYVSKFDEAIYVLHCFQKKTEATAKQDKDIATARYRAVVQKRRSAK